MLAVIAVGLVLVVGGVLVRPRTRAGDRRATGTVVESWSGHALGDPAWKCTVEFQDDEGGRWRFEPPLTTARRRAVGTPVTVVYSPADPAGTARKADGLDAALHRLLVGLGVVLVVAALLARCS